MLTFGSLFAGIGGFDLGLERSGMQCQWQVEIDPFCQKVLAKHWPNVRRFSDVREFAVDSDESLRVDVICGGFPCQDISYAGRGAGLSGERSGLFFEVIRVVRKLRPRFIVLENVAALLTRGLDRVLGSLAEIGYDAEWHCIPASYLGAPHQRDRIWIIANATCPRIGAISTRSWAEGQGEANLNRDSKRLDTKANSERREERDFAAIATRQKFVGWKVDPRRGDWSSEPNVGRVAHGVPNRVHRLKGLGNAVVPQIAELIGKSIIDCF